MNKLSKPGRIYIIFRNYGAFIVSIPVICIGLWCSWKFLKLCFSGGLDWFGGILAVGMLTIWGLIAARFGAPIFGSRFGDFFYAPKTYLKTAPEILSPIKGLIARQEYEAAIEKLDELLEEKPFSPEPYLMLVELYGNELNAYLRAMEMVENYFKQRKVYIFEENIDMLMLYADLCQEHNYLKKAERLLAQEVKRKGYPEIKRKALATRLDAVRENCEL